MDDPRTLEFLSAVCSSDVARLSAWFEANASTFRSNSNHAESMFTFLNNKYQAPNNSTQPMETPLNLALLMENKNLAIVSRTYSSRRIVEFLAKEAKENI